MCIKEREEKKTEILVKYCSSRNRGFNRYAKRQESCDKMIDTGSVGWVLSKCSEALGWICLLFSPAHPSESFHGVVAGLHWQGHWWLQHGSPFRVH